MNDSDSFAWLPFVLQTGDALFPTGAYAHSFALEELVRLGVVRDEATLSEHLRAAVLPALAALELPWLRLVRQAARARELELLCDLDREISAWKLPRETRAASRQIGARRLAILAQIAPDPFLASYQNEIVQAKTPGHHLAVAGLQFADVPLPAALTAWTYQALAAVCSAALKLIRIGQEGCQRALTAALSGLVAAISQSLEIEREDAGWFDPLLEIAAMRHAEASERLFIS